MTAPSTIAETGAELLRAWGASPNRYSLRLHDCAGGRIILRASAEEQRAFVMAALAWVRADRPDRALPWLLVQFISPLLRRPLPFAEEDLLALAAHVTGVWSLDFYIEPYLARIFGAYLARSPRTPAIAAALAEIIAALESCAIGPDQRRRLLRLRELAGVIEQPIPILGGDEWGDAALAELSALAPGAAAAWATLLRHCAAAGGSAPSAKWRKTAGALAEQVGAEALRATLLRLLALAERANLLEQGWMPSGMSPRNADILRGLALLCADRCDRDVARALAALAASAYRRVPGVGPRAVRLGNACVWALGQGGGREGLAQLARLKARLRGPGPQRQIAAAIAGAAGRAGLAPEEIEELLVPTYGLGEGGVRREPVGDITAELSVEGGAAILRYLRADGRRLSAPPAAVRAAHREELRELTQAAADARSMLAAQRDRIEQLFLRRRSWPLAVWRERYLDHPLVGSLARRLIWRLGEGGARSAAMWHEGRLAGPDGRPIEAGGEARVSLWHPLDATTDEVLAWRGWLEAREVQQPFKQAHREIYLLTDAERATRTYSNRFAAHIIRQHQFNALCAARGWRNQLRLMVDDVYAPAARELPEWGLRAEYWVEGAGSDHGVDTNETGTFRYLSTDQVRFYRIDAAQHAAHARGGGYFAGRGGRGPEPLPLEQIPPLVLSEVMRDVDLFVGVASVGNDPTWGDGGGAERFRAYWQGYSFGALSEMAKARRETLARLLPRLRIAPRCHLTDRFLVVRGDIRTYKIHLGSGNIQMEPHNQYLCIVPGRGAARDDGTRFVPFEGDGTLAIILSKALMLADDTTITDQTITSQIRR